MIYNNYRYSFFNEDDDMTTTADDDATVEVDVDDIEGQDYSDSESVEETFYMAMYEDARNWGMVSEMVLREEDSGNSFMNTIKKWFEGIIETIKKWISKIIGMISDFINNIREFLLTAGIQGWVKKNTKALKESKVKIISVKAPDVSEENNFSALSDNIIHASEFTGTLKGSGSLEQAETEMDKQLKSNVKAVSNKEAIDEVKKSDIFEYKFGGDDSTLKKIPKPEEIASSVDGFKNEFKKLVGIQNEFKKAGKNAIDAVNNVKKNAEKDDKDKAKEAASKCSKLIQKINRFNMMIAGAYMQGINTKVKLWLAIGKVYVSGKGTDNIKIESKEEVQNNSAMYFGYKLV